MKLNQKLVAGGAAALIASLGVGGAAMAATSTDSSTNPQNSLVQKIADKFHLNKSDVQAVFDQNRAEHEANHEAKLKARLDQAVKDGKLTQDQETKLLDEIKTLHDQAMSEDKADRQDFKTKLDQWARDNGIDLSQVMPAPPMHLDRQ